MMTMMKQKRLIRQLKSKTIQEQKKSFAQKVRIQRIECEYAMMKRDQL